LVILQVAPLLFATQLEELYLTGPHPLGALGNQPLFGLLPVKLKRLSWDLSRNHRVAGDLSHLTQLTFLRLCNWPADIITSSMFPPGLQQLQLGLMTHMDHGKVLEKQLPVVTGWDTYDLTQQPQRQLITRLPNVETFSVDVMELCHPQVPAALKQLGSVTALTVDSVANEVEDEREGMRAALPTAASMHSLRRLHLSMGGLLRELRPTRLQALTQLTQLRVSDNEPGGSTEKHRRMWVKALGRMGGLQWLSVPHVLLTAGQGWLGGLQQLRVLVLSWAGETAADVSHMPWLEGGSWEALPPQLQVLGVNGMTAQQAAGWQLRRCLQQVVGSSGCEVVVGVSLDEAADPTQQLAGLPVALQQALA
jgi:hypothetical protein